MPSAAMEARSARSFTPPSPSPPPSPPPSLGVALDAGVLFDVGVLPSLLSLPHAASSATSSARAATTTRPFIPHRPKLKIRPPCIILLQSLPLQRAGREKITGRPQPAPSTSSRNSCTVRPNSGGSD